MSKVETGEPDRQDRMEPYAGHHRRLRHTVRMLAFALFVAFLIVSTAWFWWLFFQIQRATAGTSVVPASAIAVFGAAEYNGRPSPVLNARLEHALDLYQRGFAPVIITLGGGSDPQYSEGGIGRDFLLAHGVPDDRIIAETNSSNTEESVARLAAIARENHLQTIIAVSDGTHLFRIQKLCRAQGLHVLLSPREAGKYVGKMQIWQRYVHEMVSYTLWQLHLH